VWAIVGATVILGTFLVKDVKSDSLKDLIDSIDSAENTYLIRTENHRNLRELKAYKKEFEEFRQHLKKPVVHGTNANSSNLNDFDPDTSNNSESKDFDLAALSLAREEQTANNELLDDLIRLAEKLPEGPRKEELNALDHKNWAIKISIEVIWRSMTDPPKSVIDQAANIKSINQELYDESKTIEQTSTEIDSLSETILETAEAERKDDEFFFAIWTRVFYGLYLIGWTIGIIAILKGEGEDKKEDLLEQITEIIA
jgi:methyl-accepting chemotaxis protein